MEMMRAQFNAGNHLCVGLDLDYDQLPPRYRNMGTAGQMLLAWGRDVVDQTCHIAGFYKPNTAFFERWGEDGEFALRNLLLHIYDRAPQVPVIADRKPGDIGNTNKQTAKRAFDVLDADAITLNPYTGLEGAEPFLENRDKGVFILCRTSNRKSDAVQCVECVNPEFPHWGNERIRYFEYIARMVERDWNTNGNCGLVVGATHPSELESVRKTFAPSLPILSPGVGKQGGDLEATLAAAGYMNIIINASSSICSAEDYRVAARCLHEKIRECIVKAFVKPIN